MLPRYILRRLAIGIAGVCAAALSASAQPAQTDASQKIAMQALMDICAKDMPDVAKIQAFARKRWNEPKNIKGQEHWRIAVPGKGEFVLSAGPQDNGQVCTVYFVGTVAGAVPDIEARFKVTKSQVVKGMRLWMITLNGKEGMVFVTGHPESRYNINVGIYLE